MRELSLNILDICKNSTKAKATCIEISICCAKSKDLLSIEISDNGCGMEEEFLQSIADPFTTTRTTRKVGMGIPLFKMSAEQAGGEFQISSKVGVGTKVFASYQISSVDRVPLGDIASTIGILIGGDPQIDFVLRVSSDAARFDFSSAEVAQIVGQENMCEPEVVEYVYQMISDNTIEILGEKI